MRSKPDEEAMSHYCGAQEAGRIPWGCEPQCDECAEYEKAEAGDVDDYEPDYSDAERLIGREICQETRKYDLREMRSAANPRLNKC